MRSLDFTIPFKKIAPLQNGRGQVFWYFRHFKFNIFKNVTFWKKQEKPSSFLYETAFSFQKQQIIIEIKFGLTQKQNQVLQIFACLPFRILNAWMATNFICNRLYFFGLLPIRFCYKNCTTTILQPKIHSGEMICFLLHVQIFF